MNKILCFCILIVCQCAFAQGVLQKAPSGEERFANLADLALPFWGHIQQYRVNESTIIVLFPDNHAEEYVNAEKKDEIACGGFATLLVDRKSAKMRCSRLVGIKDGFKLKLGFSKQSLKTISRVEKLLGCAKIIIENKGNAGFTITIDWVPWQKTYPWEAKAEYSFKDDSKGYIAIDTAHPMPPPNNWDGTVLVNVREMESEPSAGNPCDEYANRFLEETSVKCPYYFVNHDDDDPQFGTIREEFHYLYTDVVFDERLPHERLFSKATDE